MSLLDQMIMGCCIVNTGVDNLNDFETKVKTALSSMKYNLVVILIANYNSCSKAVKYFVENFTTLDILSNDIDFNLPGYTDEKSIPISSKEAYNDEIIEQALSLLHGLSDDALLTNNTHVLRLKEELLSLKSQPQQNDNENYHGTNRKIIIDNHRLGTIWFKEEAFASFVADLTKQTDNKYVYLGGCDLVMIPCFDSKLQYDQCHTYRLDNIVNMESNLSIDGFLYGLLEILRRNNSAWQIPDIHQLSYKETLAKFKECYSTFLQFYDESHTTETISIIKADGEQLLTDSQNHFNQAFRKNQLMLQAREIIQRLKNEYDQIVAYASLRDINSLYLEATKEMTGPSDEEIVKRIIRDIEQHVHWKLTEDFFFISYSTKDKTKAELIRKKLQEEGAKVWIAPDGIPQGRDYSMVIPTTLRYTKNFVLILTANSAKSKWVSREIDAAINNSSTNLKIILANGFRLNQLENYPDFGFYLNKVQVSFRYEDIIQDVCAFEQFMM